MFKTPEDRLSEIQLYELVAEELEQGEQSKGLWAKALAEGEGNIEKAKGLYIKLRVEMIKDEWAYAEKVSSKDAKRDVEGDNSEPAPTASLGRRMFGLLLLFLIPLLGLILFPQIVGLFTPL